MKITSKKELANIIEAERKNLFGNKKITKEMKYRHSFKLMYFEYLCALRKYEFCCCVRDNKSGLASRLWALRVKKADRKKNLLSEKTGVNFVPFSVEPGVTVCHPNVILNGKAGAGCVFHGNNVLGNKKTGSNETPSLGKNVEVGFGAVIIGNITIADGCVIGAGAVVTKSFTEPGTKIAGVPAKKL